MKPLIYVLNGWIVLENEPHLNDFDWLTKEKHGNDYVFYFLPHEWSLEWFKRDIVPILDYFTLTSMARDVIMKTQFTRWRLTARKVIEPFDKPLLGWQKDVVMTMLKHSHYGLFLGTGTGKTYIAVSYIMSSESKRIVVFTKQKVIDQYMNVCKKYLPDMVVTDDYHIYEESSKCLYVTNYEQGLKGINRDGDTLILDESHKAKTISTLTNETMREASKMFRDVYLFSGSPMDRNRFEVIGQLCVLEPRIVPTKMRFLNRFFELDEYFRPQKEIRKEELDLIIKSLSFGAETEELIDLPPMEEHIVKCPRPGYVYNEIVNKHLYISDDGRQTICDTPGKFTTKLRQACNGFIYMDDDTTLNFNCTKYVPLLDLLRCLTNGIIYTRFDDDIKTILDACDELHKTRVYVNGKTKKKLAAQMIEEFKNDKYDFLIMQAESGDAGLDIWNTNNVIFFSLPESYVTFHQCQSRIRRYGKPGTAHFYYFVCEGSIETKVLARLKQKKSFVSRSYRIY